MRLYRAKSVQTGELVYGYYVEILGFGKVLTPYIANANCALVKVDPATVSQSTGLRETTGKKREVYQGDRVKGINKCVISNPNYAKVEGIVVWDTETLSWHVKGSYIDAVEPCYQFLVNIKDIEVIGTRWDEESK